MNGNTITLTGNLTRDPELRYTASGRGVASFGVASNRSWKDKNGEWQEDTTFFDVTAWGDLGENVAASLNKGTAVIVSGRMQTREWETKDGQKRIGWDVIADNVGPDLRRAQAQVERTQRSDSSQPSQAPARPPIYGDEEPF